MAPRKRRTARIAGAREAQSIAATLGREARTTRRRRLLTQAALGARVGLGQSEISHLERGHGGHTSIETWVAIGIDYLELPVIVDMLWKLVLAIRDRRVSEFLREDFRNAD